MSPFKDERKDSMKPVVLLRKGRVRLGIITPNRKREGKGKNQGRRKLNRPSRCNKKRGGGSRKEPSKAKYMSHLK